MVNIMDYGPLQYFEYCRPPNRIEVHSNKENIKIIINTIKFLSYTLINNKNLGTTYAQNHRAQKNQSQKIVNISSWLAQNIQR